MDQGESEDVQDAEHASVGEAETADAKNMDDDVTSGSRGEHSTCAVTDVDHTTSPSRVSSLLKQSCLVIETSLLLVISSLPWAGKPFV